MEPIRADDYDIFLTNAKADAQVEPPNGPGWVLVQAAPDPCATVMWLMWVRPRKRPRYPR
jgi:hypothetical protein